MSPQEYLVLRHRVAVASTDLLDAWRAGKQLTEPEQAALRVLVQLASHLALTGG